MIRDLPNDSKNRLLQCYNICFFGGGGPERLEDVSYSSDIKTWQTGRKYFQL